MNVGINFFGPKRKLYHDFEGTLDILKEKGITSVELCVSFSGGGEPPKELNLQIPPEIFREMSGGIWPLDVAAERLAAVRAHGFTVLSCHMMLGFQFSPELLIGILPTLVEFGRENGIRYYVFSPMKGLADIKPMIPTIREVSDTLAQSGITLLLHNHEVECLPEEGTTVLDYILEQCPNLGLELDVGWAKFAGVSPVELMRKYAARIPLLHFKDVTPDACAANRETCFTAVGEGSIPLREIMAEAPNCAIIEHGLIIDQDDSPTDILEDIGRGVANICASAN
jgi:sugar phosphate isomerase/epimerase